MVLLVFLLPRECADLDSDGSDFGLLLVGRAATGYRHQRILILFSLILSKVY